MEFKSAITRGGNAVLPEIIDISEYDITWKKRNKTLISSDSISIPINAISSVEIETYIIGTTIKIKSQGQGEIIASNFTASDANDIKRIINQYKSNNEQSKEIKITPKNPEIELKQFEEDKYHEIDRIPLISFSDNANAIITELNKLNSLYKHSINQKDQKKSTVYINKIYEGIRLIEVFELNPQQKQLVDIIKHDLHETIIKNNLFQGWKISINNSEKTKIVLYFILRHKWWAIFIFSLIYVMIRNFLEHKYK